ncbi:hypothetical protein [Vibrio penaeicida]|uniref:hypothetical protein n=1 Tax=Vibrio penaeicida TaxID=104609 RepID=UPI000CEA2908|nr:hypothetical protein [Vibrio penaeicida]
MENLFKLINEAKQANTLVTDRYGNHFLLLPREVVPSDASEFADRVNAKQWLNLSSVKRVNYHALFSQVSPSNRLTVGAFDIESSLNQLHLKLDRGDVVALNLGRNH